MTKFLLCSVLALLLWSPGAWAAPDLKKGLILQYAFDTNNGSTVLDQSPGNHPGQVYGATFTPNGRFGGAYYFNGQNNYILAGNLGYQPTGTISFWLNADEVKNWRNPFSTDFASWDDNIRFEENSNGGLEGGGLGLGRGGSFTESLMPHRWYHVVYMWDANYAYGFLNGVMKFKNPHPDPNSLVHPNLPLTAGQYRAATLTFSNVAIGNGYSQSPERFWKGYIDEVRMYNRALTPEEVVKLYENKDDSLVLYLPFDAAPQANIAPDESGEGNNGTVQGGVAFIAGEGKGKGAYEFHGTNESIYIGKSSTLNVGSQLTLSAWYKTYDRSSLPASARQNPILEYSNGARSGVHMWTNTIGSQWNLKGTGANLIDTTGNETAYVISTPDKPANEWHHLVITYSNTSSNGEARLYMDGVLAESRQMPLMTPQTSYDLYIGKRPWDTQVYKGLIDEVRVYNRALNALEVRALYDSTALGRVYQNFETGNGTPPPPGNPAGQPEYGWGINGASVALSTAFKHAGAQSLAMISPAPYGGIVVPAQIETYTFNAQPQRHDRLTFWVLSNATDQADHELRVKMFDKGAYQANGFEVFTTRKAKYNQWTPITVLFTQLPNNFDFKRIDKIQFVSEAPGQYYFDDIQIESQDRYYQDFEPWACSSANPAGCRDAVWNGSAAITTDKVYSGTQAWKLTGTTNWTGVGIKNQERRCFPLDTCTSQEAWRVDLNPIHLDPKQYDRLSFWMYQQADNGMANNVEVKFFDHGKYKHQGTSGVSAWTKKSGEYGQWARLSIPFRDLPADLDLTDLDQIELSLYWPGTYYFDDIRAGKGSSITIDPSYISSGIVKWNRVPDAGNYTLQQSTAGPAGPWTTLNANLGTQTTFVHNRLGDAWLRVRWETAPAKNAAPYLSDWSDAVPYRPAPALIKNATLQQQGVVTWSYVPQATRYEVQKAASQSGPWSTVYTGGYSITPLMAEFNTWYRVRPLRTDAAGTVLEPGRFSPPLLYNPAAFLRASGKTVRENNGTGAVIPLRGVNLGNYDVLEPWMLGEGDFQNRFTDDWTIRTKLGGNARRVLEGYRQAYLQDIDFDNIMRTGANFVRLPIYYKNIRDIDDATGQWAAGSSFDWSGIDRIIAMCADRGLYVLLDLHGAPGMQNDTFHSGRNAYNKLFAPDALGTAYKARTRELWQAIAARYRTEPVVMGYDLLNEPTGVFSYPPYNAAALHTFYNDLYHAVRDADKGNDTNHLVVIEGVWDWESLPGPTVYGWQNVMYQFHYYCQQPAQNQQPVLGDTCPAGPADVHLTYQKAFIDKKIANSRQNAYNVPAMIGEFNGYGLKSVWDYYLTTFNAAGYSWAMWSYKTHPYTSSYGLYTHFLYDEALPDFNVDTMAVLERKMSKYDTVAHHVPNQSLIDILKKYTPRQNQVQ